MNLFKNFINMFTKYIVFKAVDDSANQRSIAPVFDKEKSYVANEFCTHGGFLWKAAHAIPSGRDFNENEWIESNVMSDSASSGEVRSVMGKTGHVILDVETDLAGYKKTTIDSLLAGKAAAGSSYSKTEEDGLLAGKRNLSDSYSKDEVDAAVNSKISKPATSGAPNYVLALDTDGVTPVWKAAAGGNVESVNGKVGVVVLEASDVGAYTTSQVDSIAATKANTADIYNKSQIDTALSAKANTGDSYLKSEEDTLLAAKMNAADGYTKTQTDSLLAGKEDLGYSYSKAESNTLLADKVNTADMTSALALKANTADVYDKAAVDSKVDAKLTKPTTAGAANYTLVLDTDGVTPVWKEVPCKVRSVNAKDGDVILYGDEIKLEDAPAAVTVKSAIDSKVKAPVATGTAGMFLALDTDGVSTIWKTAGSATAPVTSVQSMQGDVVLDSNDIKINKSDASSITIKQGLTALESAVGNVYTKSATDTLLSAKADKTDVYTRSETDTELAKKTDKPTTAGTVGQVLSLKDATTGETEWKNVTIPGTFVTDINGMTGSVEIDGSEITVDKTTPGSDSLNTAINKKIEKPDSSVVAGKVLKSTGSSGYAWQNESITDVNGKSGSVTLYGSDIKVHNGTGSTTIKETIDLIDITLQNTYLKSETYSKSDVNSLLSNKADKSDSYTKSELYTKTETNTELAKKIDKPATTVASGSIPVSNGAGNVTWRAESVLSVNGNTGTINISAADVNAVKTPDTPGTAGQFLALDTDGNTVIWKSSSSSIDSVNGKTGVVVLSGEDIKVNTVSATDVGTAITTLETNVANKADASNVYTKTEVDTKDATKITKPTTAGTAAQILRIKDAATQEVEWADPSSATAPVTSVNSKLGDVILYGDEIAIDNSVGAATIKETTDALQTSVNNKYNKSETYSRSETNALLANKADSSDVYTMTEVDTLLSGKVDTGTVYLKSETYSQAEVTTLMAAKANTSDVYNKTQVYTKTEVDEALANKASVGDSYTKAEENSLLDAKANASDVYSKTNLYTKTEVDTAMSAKANTADVYNKSVLYTKTETDTELGKKIDKPATTVVSGYIPKSNGTGDVTWASETITSVNTKTGAVVLSATDVGAAAETHTHSASDITSGNIAADRITSVNLDALTATTTCPTIPLSLLPSYVSNVVEVNSFSDLPATGESNKIYLTKDTNKSYRWGGTSYVELATGVALGETELTAYRGDRGKIAYEHSLTEGSLGSAIAQGMYKVGFSATGHITSYDTVAKSDLDAIVGDNIGKVNGVSVNGTAITLDSSYVANIPAGTSSNFGVVKVDGTSISSTSGIISVVEASSANISARNSTAVIDTKNYDAAVKQALVDNANSSVVYSAADELAARTLINSAGRQDIAATYSATSTYSAGDLAYHDGVLYKAKAAITTAEPWTPEHWDTTTIAASMGSAGAGMPIYEAYDGAKSYSVGARVSYESKYYMAKVNTVGILPTVSTNWIEVVPETELANQLTALAVALGASLSVVWDSTNNKFTYTYNI